MGSFAILVSAIFMDLHTIIRTMTDAGPTVTAGLKICVAGINVAIKPGE